MQLKYVQLVSCQGCFKEVILKATVFMCTYHLRAFLWIHSYRQIHIGYIWQTLSFVKQS